MSDEAKRRKIKQLRALADSTTFPAEAESARAKADKLQAELGGPRAKDDHGPNARAAPQGPDPRHFSDAYSYLRAAMQHHGIYSPDDFLHREMNDYLNGAKR